MCVPSFARGVLSVFLSLSSLTICIKLSRRTRRTERGSLQVSPATHRSTLRHAGDCPQADVRNASWARAEQRTAVLYKCVQLLQACNPAHVYSPFLRFKLAPSPSRLDVDPDLLQGLALGIRSDLNTIDTRFDLPVTVNSTNPATECIAAKVHLDSLCFARLEELSLPEGLERECWTRRAGRRSRWSDEEENSVATGAGTSVGDGRCDGETLAGSKRVDAANNKRVHREAAVGEAEAEGE